MKKTAKTIVMLLLVTVSLFWGLHSCTKTTEGDVTTLNKIENPGAVVKTTPMTNQEITSLAKSIGYLHNALIDKVAREVNLVIISKEDYKKAIYATKIEGFNLKYVESKVVFDKTGIADIENFINKTFSKLPPNEIAYLKKIFHATENFTTAEEKNKLFDNLLNGLLNDVTLNVDSKIKLATALELGRASMFYWFASRNDKSNPYYKAFYSNTSNSYPLFSCESYIDLSMYVISYNEYIANGYTPAQAAQAAGYDGAYQSGLAGMPGGACNS